MEIPRDIRSRTIRHSNEGYGLLLDREGVDKADYPIYTIFDDQLKTIQYQTHTGVFLNNGNETKRYEGKGFKQLMGNLLAHPNEFQSCTDLSQTFKIDLSYIFANIAPELKDVVQLTNQGNEVGWIYTPHLSVAIHK